MVLLSSTWHPRLETEPSGFSQQGPKRAKADAYRVRACTPAAHMPLSVPFLRRKAAFLEVKKGTILVDCVVSPMPGVVSGSSVCLSYQDKPSGHFSLRPVEILIS